jgi:hypothetical protein
MGTKGVDVKITNGVIVRVGDGVFEAISVCVGVKVRVGVKVTVGDRVAVGGVPAATCVCPTAAFTVAASIVACAPGSVMETVGIRQAVAANKTATKSKEVLRYVRILPPSITGGVAVIARAPGRASP